MGISNEKHVLDSSGEIVYRDDWMSRAISYADEHGFSVIRDMSNGEIREKDEYGVWIVVDRLAGQLPALQFVPQVSNDHSDLVSRLLEMAANPPGMNGILTERGYLGSAHVDLGWVAAIRMVIEMVTSMRTR